MSARRTDIPGAIDWDAPWIRQRLGVDYDSAIAQDLGVSDETVRRARTSRGIPAAGPRGPGEPRAGRHRINWDAPGIRPRLGVEPDRTIARDLGVTQDAVADARKRRSIPAPPRTIDWDSPAIRKRLGTMPDAKLAAELGVARNTVTRARIARGIPACGPELVPLGDVLRRLEELEARLPDLIAEAVSRALHSRAPPRE